MTENIVLTPDPVELSVPNFAWAISPNPTSDYFVFTRRLDQEFSWDIKRRSRPLGVKVSGGRFRSRDAAGLAGRRALMDFFLALADEEARSYARAGIPK
jgi:hypothetical protein